MKLIALIFAVVAASATTKPCEPELTRDESKPDAAHAPADLARAETELAQAFVGLSLWGGRSWEDLVPRAHRDALTENFSLAVGMRVRGLDAYADEITRKFTRLLKEAAGPKVNLARLRAEIAEIAARPSIERPFAVAGLRLKNEPEPTALFERINQITGGPLVAGPQQAEMVNLIHQFGHPSPGDRVLVMGVGAPAMCLATQHYSPRALLTGFDTHSAPAPRVRAALVVTGVTMGQGAMSDDVLEDLADGGTYQTVAALDLIAADPQFREVFLTKPLSLARRLRKLVKPSGLLLILNDFASEPPFSRADAEKAGFTVLRWAVDRTLRPEQTRDIPYFADAYRAGEMRAFVLRNGAERRLESAKVYTRNAKSTE